MDQEPIRITCKKCSVTFLFKSILQHAIKSPCKESYSQDHLSSLKKQPQYIRSAKQKIKMAERYQLNKEKVRKKYQQKKYDYKTRIWKDKFGPSNSTVMSVDQYFKEENKEKLTLELLDIGKSCKKEFGDTSILRHLQDKSCSKDYDLEEMEYIRGWATERKKIIYSDYYENNKQEIKLKSKEYWAENKASRVSQRREKAEKKKQDLLERCKSYKKKFGDTRILMLFFWG